MFPPTARKLCLLVFGALECLCFGGWIFGWASLVFVFKREGYFAEKCPTVIGSTLGPVGTSLTWNDTTESSSDPPVEGCEEQDAELQLVFTVTNFCVSGASLPLGFLYDRMGTLFMRIVISILMMAGSLMFALSSMNPILVFPAAVLVSTGGVQLLVVNLQISNLFGRNKWIVMTLFCGCFDSSAWIFLVVKVLYETADIDVQTSFFILLGSTCFLALNTFFLLPKKGSIPWPLPPGYSLGSHRDLEIKDVQPKYVYNNAIITTDDECLTVTRENDQQETDQNKQTVNASINTESSNDPNDNVLQPISLHSNGVITTSKDSNSNDQTNHTNDLPTLRACVFTPTFFLFYIWFSVLQLDVLFFVSTLNPVLTRLADNDENIVSKYTNELAFIQLGGILCAPLSGLLLSRNKRSRRYKNEAEEEERLRQRGPYSDMKDSALVYAVTTALSIAFCICALLPILEVQYGTFVLSVISRSFIYSLTASGISLFFPMEYFGTLYGLMIVLSSVFSLLQYPLFIITQKILHDNDFWVKIGLLTASTVTFSFPIYTAINARRKEKMHQSKLSSATISACRTAVEPESEYGQTKSLH